MKNLNFKKFVIGLIVLLAFAVLYTVFYETMPDPGVEILAAGAIYDGKALRLFFDDKKFYHATTCSLQVASKTQEVASKDTDGDVITMDGYGGTLSTDALFADIEAGETATQVNAAELLALQIAETLIAFKFTTGTSGDVVISGNCYVINADLGAEKGNKATAGFQFKTTGTISVGAVV